MLKGLTAEDMSADDIRGPGTFRVAVHEVRMALAHLALFSVTINVSSSRHLFLQGLSAALQS